MLEQLTEDDGRPTSLIMQLS